MKWLSHGRCADSGMIGNIDGVSPK
jgi:hypothetical protein